MIYLFGSYELDAQTGELRKSGVRIKFGGQPLEVLTLLVERQGGLVTRDELKDALWKQESFTDFDHGVNTAIQRIRRTLDDSAQTPRFIETLPRKGYRFIAPVERGAGDALQSSPDAVGNAADEQTRADSEPRRVWPVIATAVLILILAGVWIFRPRPEAEQLRFTDRALTFGPGSERNPSGGSCWRATES